MSLVELSRLPHHVAIIMDGNGRWAKDRGRPRWEGHREGAKSVRKIVEASRRLGLKALTLYAFSEQNWARPEEEVNALMALLAEYLLSEREKLIKDGVRFRSIGRLSRLPQQVLKLVEEVTSATAHCTGMTLTLCLSYGGREEVADAAQELARRVQAGEMSIEDLNEDAITKILPSSLGVGPVDLLVRTGGEFRTSNFLIWAGAYAELHFSPNLWPEFGQPQLFEAVYAFQQRNRRFGLADNVQGPNVTASQEVLAKAIAG
ncbi:MAG: polyprenyl diphosphate synthase [Myxococcales bacterium]